MGTKRKDDKKINLTIRIKTSIVKKLKSIDGYNSVIEKLLEDYFNDREKD